MILRNPTDKKYKVFHLGTKYEFKPKGELELPDEAGRWAIKCIDVLVEAKEIKIPPASTKKETPVTPEVLEKDGNGIKPEGKESTTEESKGESESEEKKNPLKCSECGFIAKSKFGLIAHQRKHQK